MVFDIWRYSNSESKVFTDSEQILNIIFDLIKVKHVSATYYYKGKLIGWDIIVPDEYIPEFKNKIKTISKTATVEKKSVYDVINDRFNAFITTNEDEQVSKKVKSSTKKKA